MKDSGEFSETVPSAVGEYTVKATIAATDNYNGGEATADFTISKANLTPSVSIEGWAYGETANTPSVTGNTENGAVAYAYKLKTAEDEAYNSGVPVNAGTYKVRAVIEETDNYSGKIVEAEFTIDQAPLTISGITAANKTYDGTTNAELNCANVTFDGILDADAGKLTVTATGAFADENADNGKTVNISGLTLEGSSADNYMLAESGNQETTTANITPATLENVIVSQNGTLTYNGAEQTPQVSAGPRERMASGR